MNPLALEGQLHGGTIQGLGLALTEELVTDGWRRARPRLRRLPHPDDDGRRRRPDDRPRARQPGRALRAAGVGEMPSISSTPAVLAALRAATGRELTRVPVRPEDLAV